jgi:PST family polysaccharide transporter/lipopolysaccharide exporter
MKDRLRALLVRFTPTGSVLEQTVKSGAWMGAMNVSGRALQLVMVIILANLLNPVEFGLLGIGLLVLSGLNKFSKLGLNAAVIHQKEENVDEYMDTMWVLQLVRGGLLAGILLLLAPVIGSVFGEPQAIPVVRALALSPVLIALRNPAVVYFQKRLDFHMEFAYQMGGSLTRFVVVHRVGLRLTVGLGACCGVARVRVREVSDLVRRPRLPAVARAGTGIRRRTRRLRQVDNG